MILASQSPRRKALLSSAGIAFEVDVSQADEPVWDGVQSPEEYTRSLALLKAREVSSRHVGEVVLGADTVVALDGVIYGKPKDWEDAWRMLRRFSGREHHVFTGVALVKDGAVLHSWTADTAVRFKVLDDAVIRRYFELVNVLDKAGAYGIQEHGEMIVDEIRGSYSNVVGLPVEEVKAVLFDKTHEQ